MEDELLIYKKRSKTYYFYDTWSLKLIDEGFTTNGEDSALTER